ncbi:[protein-PII] uridylyltransferase [Brachymonas sp.]|uniref:[protein-PII] uridylyltransferase n=1 Tax=unclassified Brachymonas TaxID=2621329 RepID=UPI0035B3FEDA
MSTPSPFSAPAPLTRQDYQAAKQALLAPLADESGSVRAMRSIMGILHRLAQLTDHSLTALWQQHGLDRERVALAAVGGFGRGELYPYSDVDVLILLPMPMQEAGADLRQRIEAFVGSCWDMGLEIGSSVRSVQECVAEAEKDITVQTALLERRLITGPADLYDALSAAYDSAMHPYGFYLAKTLEMRQRHGKYENTPYSLEPNCKESPGGLRDLQVVLWVAKAAGYGDSWSALMRSGLMTPYEARHVRRSYVMLSLVRTRLHMVARRREDRLIFDLQDPVAKLFGYALETPSSRAGKTSPLRPSEALMKHYYWTAKAVTQLTQILLLNIAERLQASGHTREDDPAPVTEAMKRLQDSARAQQARAAIQAEESGNSALALQETVNPVASTAVTDIDYEQQTQEPRHLPSINERFLDNNGLLEVATDDLYFREPHAILETFILAQREIGISGLSARTLRALYNARVIMDSAFRRDPVHHRQFMEILQAPSGVTHALRLMNQTSVLGRYLWVFRKIVGQMQHDLFHVYTVDQHILMVVRNVRRFFIPEHAHEYPFCSQLAAGWDAPWILSTAALFHDIAKGRGGDHSQLGEQEVRKFAKIHGISQEDTDLIAFLVRQHLTMSMVAQKQDISDPDVITAFAKTVGNERYLTALYLLTVADIRGTSPKVWNGWKGKLLEDLYKATLRVLGGHVPDLDALVEARKRDAQVELARYSMPFEGHLKLWNALDVSYFMRHDANEIAWHTRHIARHAGQGRTIVRARLSPHGEGLQVLVYTPDQPELFARICGYFDSASFSILDAKVHTTTDGYALDTFQVVTSIMPEHYREFMTMVESSLTHVLEHPGALPEPSHGRLSRRAKSFPMTPTVQFTPDEKVEHWLITINASDRMGLLYRITRVLAHDHIHLQLAHISTMGDRVEDTFLVKGKGLSSGPVQARLESDLLDAISAA